MSKRTKKLAALITMGTMFVTSALPAIAATDYPYGHTVNYSNKILSATRAQAVTSCATATNVQATVTVICNIDGKVGQVRSATNTGRVATTAVVDIGNGQIFSISSYHKVWLIDQGITKTWEKNL